MTKTEFIKQVAIYVKKYAPRYNILVYSPIIAQACLESGYGTSELATQAHNYFGLKYNASISEKNAYIKIGSEQNSDGSYISSTMKWCNFNSFESGVQGYFKFLFERPGVTRYNNLKNITNPKQYLENIKADGYATSLKYVDNLLRVIKTNNLTAYDERKESTMLIAIDAGHGSNTAGKRTPDGYREHWGNVMVASYFAKAMDRCSINYIKTGWDDDNSKDDPDTALSRRQKTIKNAKCDYSISFHFNACGDGKSYNSGQGIETLISNKAPGDSLRMAQCIQKYLIQGTTQKNRGVKTQSLAMCNCSTMGTKASVLIECAFMTNQRESELMKTEAFCKECAEEAAKGFCEYIGIKYVAEGAASTPIKPSTNPTTPATTAFKVRITATSLKVRKGPGTNYNQVTSVKKGSIFTIVETNGNWGKLKSGAGWIHLSYTERI